MCFIFKACQANTVEILERKAIPSRLLTCLFQCSHTIAETLVCMVLRGVDPCLSLLVLLLSFSRLVGSMRIPKTPNCLASRVLSFFEVSSMEVVSMSGLGVSVCMFVSFSAFSHSSLFCFSLPSVAASLVFFCGRGVRLDWHNVLSPQPITPTWNHMIETPNKITNTRKPRWKRR